MNVSSKKYHDIHLMELFYVVTHSVLFYCTSFTHVHLLAQYVMTYTAINGE
jgi:hypothetical protein